MNEIGTELEKDGSEIEIEIEIEIEYRVAEWSWLHNHTNFFRSNVLTLLIKILSMQISYIHLEWNKPYSYSEITLDKRSPRQISVFNSGAKASERKFEMKLKIQMLTT